MTSVPTVPTGNAGGRNSQTVDPQRCSDRSDRSDHSSAEQDENTTSLKGLVERLRRMREEGEVGLSSRKEEGVSSRSEHLVFAPSSHAQVGTVGTVGTTCADNGLGESVGRNSARNGRNTPLPHDAAVLVLPADRMCTESAPVPARLAVSDPLAAGVVRLQRMRPLAGFTPRRWRLVQLGCASLLRSHGHSLLQLGWSAEDAFGVHPDALGAAVRCYGLGLLLQDGDVMAMSETSASIRCGDGSRQTYMRGVMPPETVLVWNCRTFG